MAHPVWQFHEAKEVPPAPEWGQEQEQSILVVVEQPVLLA